MSWRPRRGRRLLRLRRRRRTSRGVNTLSEAVRKSFVGTFYLLVGATVFTVASFAMTSIDFEVDIFGNAVNFGLFVPIIGAAINMLFLFKGIRIIGVRV